MENYLLYEDDNIKVEIDGLFHKILNSKIKSYEISSLSEKTQVYLLDFIQKEVDDKFQIQLSSTIPIIEYQNFISITKPFDNFEQGINYLACIPDLELNLRNSVIELNQLYESEDFKVNDNEVIRCVLFDNPIDNIYGFFESTNISKLTGTYKPEAKILFFSCQ